MNKRNVSKLFAFLITPLLFSQDFDLDTFLHQNLLGYEIYLDLHEKTNLNLFKESLLYFEENNESSQKQLLILEKKQEIIEYKEKAEKRFLEDISSYQNLLSIIETKTDYETKNEQNELNSLKTYFAKNNAIPTDLSILAKIQFLYSQKVFDSNFTTGSYIVQKGDCFVSISARDEIYGTYLRWQELYEANKEKLFFPEKPELIHPGIVLEIPRP